MLNAYRRPFPNYEKVQLSGRPDNRLSFQGRWYVCPGLLSRLAGREFDVQPTKSTKCTFFGGVPIDLKRFLESGVALVECPDCASTRTLEPHGGGLRFKSHDKRKTDAPNTGQR